MASVSWHQGNRYAPTVTLTVTQQSQNIANNTSTVAYSLVISRPSNISSTASKAYSITVNGTKVKDSTTTIGGSGSKTIASGTTTVTHNSDGTKSISFSFSLYIGITFSGTWLGTASGSGTLSLTPIPRATLFDSVICSTSYTNGTFTYKYTPQSSSFYNQLYVTVYNGTWHNVRNTNLGTKSTSQQTGTFSFTNEELASIYQYFPSVSKCLIYVGVRTYSDSSYSTQVGSNQYKSIELTFPTTVVPLINNVSISEATSGLAAKFNAFVQNKSKLSVSISVSGVYGSTISKYETTIQGIVYTGASFTSAVISTSGTINVVTKITDSRGRTTQVSNPITVLAYSPPAIYDFSAWRINTSGVTSDDGNRIAAYMKFSISSVNNLNDHAYTLKYKKSGESNFITFSSGEASWSYDGTQSFTSTPVISTDYAYVIRLEVTDYFQTVAYEFQIPTAFTLFDCRSTGKGIAFGKVSEKDRMEIALDVELTGELIQEEKTLATLQNNWVNYGASYDSASFWKDSCGMVHLSGLIKSGATTAETVIFTLPEGYRPALHEKFFAVSLNAICVIDVYATGNVAIKTGANSGWLSLSGISFKAS